MFNNDYIIRQQIKENRIRIADTRSKINDLVMILQLDMLEANLTENVQKKEEVLIKLKWVKVKSDELDSLEKKLDELELRQNRFNT